MAPERKQSFGRRLKWALIAVATLPILLIAALTGTAALVDAGYFHGPILRFVAGRIDRPIRVEGAAKMHLLSLHPHLVAEGVVIGNPPWMPAGPMAEIGRLSIEFELPTLAWLITIRRLELESATLRLARDAEGNANWRMKRGKLGGRGPPLMHSLSMRNAHVELRDARRHLEFDGRLSAQDGKGAKEPPLRIDGAGQLNGRAVTIVATGDPLATARRDRPYRFRYEEHSSGTHLTGRAVLAQAFDFRVMETTFAATGEDAKDMYFLAGATFPDTGAYRLTGHLQRKGLRFKFSDLVATSGQSDLRGTVGVDSSRKRSQLTIDLRSERLRVEDFGEAAANRKSDEPAPDVALLLPDTPLHLTAIRRSDATVNYKASRIDAGNFVMNAVEASVKIDNGVVTVTPLSAAYADGKLTGQIRFDASRKVPTGEIDVRFDGLQLSQFDKGTVGNPPFEGLLQGRLILASQGQSLHQLAAGANGSITTVLPQGRIRASLVEAAGMDLRALGLKISGDQATTELRCGVARLEVHDGAVKTQDVVLDTTPVLITGEGGIDLNTEVIDMTFRGHPKRPRLRLRSPLFVRGTLADPSFRIEARSSLAQVSAGVALGILLTPLAAIAALIDPGLGKDADCDALVASASAGK